jgi:hypothetical protein
LLCQTDFVDVIRLSRKTHVLGLAFLGVQIASVARRIVAKENKVTAAVCRHGNHIGTVAQRDFVASWGGQLASNLVFIDVVGGDLLFCLTKFALQLLKDNLATGRESHIRSRTYLILGDQAL